MSYYKSYNLPVKIIRPFNTFGPRQSNRAVIPRIITQCLLNNKSEIKLGNLKPLRDFNYVEDICRAYFYVLKEKKLIGEVVNIGSNTSISIENIAKKIIKITKSNLKIAQDKKIIRPKKSEVNNLKCNNKKIKKMTSWSSSTSLELGLSKTIKWIDENFSGNDNKYQI